MSKKCRGNRAARPAQTQELPEVQTQDGPGDSRFAAPGTPCVYYKRRLTHCPSCMRIYLDGNPKSRAVVTKTTKETIAYLRCRACGHSFAAPVRV